MESLVFEEHAKKALHTHRSNIEKCCASTFGAKKIFSFLESEYQNKLPYSTYIKDSKFVKYAKTFAKSGYWEELTNHMFNYATFYCLSKYAVKMYSTKDLGNTKLLYRDIKDKVSSCRFVNGESYLVDCIVYWDNEYCPTRVSVFSNDDDYLVFTVTIKQLKKGQSILHDMSLDALTMKVVAMNKKNQPATDLAEYDKSDTPLSNVLHYLCINALSIIVDYKLEMRKIPGEVAIIKHIVRQGDNNSLYVHQEVDSNIDDNTYVDFKEWVANMAYPRKEWQGGHHASPKPHNRVSHYRRCKKGNYILLDGVFREVPKGTGNYCKVRACSVNHKTDGEITKERIFTV